MKFVLGGADLQRRLEMLPRLTQGVVVRRALREAAKRVMASEVAATPIVTGVFRSQYKVRAMKRSRKGWGYTSRVAPKPGQRFYASFVNYGWFARPAGPRFIDSAIDAAAPTALDMVRDALVGELDRLGV